MEIIKEIIAALNSRIRSPIVGSIILVFVAANWKPIYYMTFSGELVENRFHYFDNHTSGWTLFAIPIGLGFLFAYVSPWITLIGAKLAKNPISQRKKLEISNEHELLVEKTNLEKDRAGLLEQQELELIQQAKRNLTVDEFPDETRDNLQKQIDKLRHDSKLYFPPEQKGTTSRNDISSKSGFPEISGLARNLLLMSALSNDGRFQLLRLGENVLSHNSAYARSGDGKRALEDGSLSWDELNDATQELRYNTLVNNVEKDEYVITPKGSEYCEWLNTLGDKFSPINVRL